MDGDNGDREATGGGEERLTLVPNLRPGVDLSRFRFDAETGSLLALMDGRLSIGNLADLAGIDADTALDRIERLTVAGVVRPCAHDEESSSDPDSGEPDSRTPLTVLQDADRGRFSGAIRFTRGDVRIAVYFDSGSPLAVSSDDPSHDIGVLLAAAGKIDPATAAAYRRAMTRGAESPAIGLYRAGVTERRELATFLTWHGSTVLKDLCSWPEFVSAATPGEPFPPKLGRCPLLMPREADGIAPAPRAPPVATATEAPAAAMRSGPAKDWRKRELDEAEAQALEQARPKYMVATPQAQRIVAGLGLDKREKRLVEHLLETPTQVSRALAISTAFRSVTRRLLVRLIDSGAFELHDTNPEGDVPHDLDDLEPCARRMAHGNHFDLLTAHAVSSPEEIRERYEKRLHEFDLRRYPNAGPEHLRALAAIRGCLDRAFAVLSDQEQRRAYRRQVHSPDQIRNFLDLQLRKAEVALKMRDDPGDALALAETVLDIEPHEVTGMLLKAGALARLGKASEARALLSRIGGVPARLAGDLREIRRAAGVGSTTGRYDGET
jgi:hypothetical protein